MGGGSNSSSSSKSSSSSSKSTELGNTTTSNPYVTSSTTNSGTTTSFQPNTSLSSIYNFTNKNIDDLLNEYLHPNINSEVNQAKLQAYSKALNDETQRALENNIIAPLARRNIIRSSQATDMYNKLAKTQADSIDDFTTSLIANSQNDTANVINTLMNLAFQGYNIINSNQAQSLNTSLGNATTSSQATSSVSSKSDSGQYGL